MRILVVRAGALGDTLMATPVIRALARRDPEASIDILCSEGATPLVELHPNVDRIFPLKWRNLPFGISREKRRVVRELGSRRHDVAVLLERAPRYRELLQRAGISDVRSFREAPFDPCAHAIVNNLRVAGLDSRFGPETDMELVVSDDDTRVAQELLAGLGRPRVGVHVGYGPRGKKRGQSERLKGWSLESFMAVVRTLSEDGASVVLTGSPEDRRDVDAIAAHVPARGLAGRTSVRQLGAVIRELDLFLSVDSGPAHMAAALGTPLVVLWGPAIFEQVRPVSSTSPITILRHPVPCAPCYGTPLMKTCQRNICMEGITPERVLEAVRNLLAAVPDRVSR